MGIYPIFHCKQTPLLNPNIWGLSPFMGIILIFWLIPYCVILHPAGDQSVKGDDPHIWGSRLVVSWYRLTK